MKYKGLVIVESPAKAKKIAGFLGGDYKVLASMGHVRDLPASASEIPEEIKKLPWATLGVNVESEFEPVYVVPPKTKKLLKELKDALKESAELVIATDEDREGESIGWHLIDLLKPKVPVRRMVFSEITKPAILHALQNTRQLDVHLVQAQETRRILDRLYGYRLSPLLWKKVAPKLSAGRVQSVAVRLLVQRELERMAFHSATYWDLKAVLASEQQAEFEAQLATIGGRRVASGKDFDETTGKLKPRVDVLLLGEEEARQLAERICPSEWRVTSVTERAESRRPAPPFITSTLQQEANRKLGMSAREAMATAQRLYQDGYITYMRTDSVHLSGEAITAARGRIEEKYGKDYLYSERGGRQYTSKSKNAQEAHEAIRPAGTEMKTGEEHGLTGRDLQLYNLIWKRTMATQMAEARLRFQTVTITVGQAFQPDGSDHDTPVSESPSQAGKPDLQVEFRATGRHIEFPGFFRAYVEGSDDPEAAIDDKEAALPPLKEQQPLDCRQVDPLGHETKPPARFTEASLVRALEEKDVGRPSTYASILSTIQDRGYVRKAGNQLVPTFTAIAVTRLLENYFPSLVDFDFTAGMEQTLDDIATGQTARLPYLKRFYSERGGLDEQVRTQEETIDPREACTLRLGGLESNVRVGRFGPYFERQENGESVTASIPDDIAPADLSNEVADKLIHLKKQGPQSLGTDPETGESIYLLSGPFGPYVQRGEVTDEHKPKRASIPPSIDPTQVTLDQAIQLLHLPHRLGHHPETGKVVNAGVGRFGPYVVHDKIYKNFDKKTGTFTRADGQVFDVLTVDLDTAVEMLRDAKKKGAPTPLKELGPHPDDGQPVAIFEGRYGPYVKHGKINATLPKERDIESVALDEALNWLAEKAAKGGGKKTTTRRTGTKTTTKKKATRKKTASSKRGS